jgi:hypothetical protein
MMQDWQVRLYLQAQSVVVEVEGMKAENEHWRSQNEPPKYREDEFSLKAQEIESISREIGMY